MDSGMNRNLDRFIPNRNKPQTPRYTNNNNQQTTQRFSRPYLGRCQACGTQGHSAKFCPEFTIVRGSNQRQWSSPVPQTHQWQQPATPPAWQPRANPAMLSDSSPWLVDSGASHHMTSDLANLSTHAPYNGRDDVLLGDGSALPITHTGERFGHGNPSSGRST